MTHEETDSQWVRRVQAGDVNAFEPLVERHQKAIYNLLYRWLGDYDEAADVAQEVFLAAFGAIAQFRGEAKFSTWLYQIAINHARNRRKQLAAKRPNLAPLDGDEAQEDGDPVARLPHPAPDAAQLMEQEECARQIQLGLDQLPSDDALIIVLHDLQGKSYDEIAELLQIPLGTMKSRLHRARQALKIQLAPYHAALRSAR